jgi:nucleotide-binding universal stress UspA family protein
MDTRKIIVPVDFTTASDQSIKQSITIARNGNYSITLFHVVNNESANKIKSSGFEEKLKEMADKVLKQGVNCDFKVAAGNIFDEIPRVSNKFDHQLMVIGTHGIKGIKQKLLGADMLKLIRKVKIPCLVVQADCACRNFNPIVLPVGGHEGFRSLIDATAMMAKLFGSEVHIYSVIRKGDEGSPKLRENTAFAIRHFEENKIPFKRVAEEVTVISVGFAKQTLQYANKVSAGLISIMSVKTDEYYYFAQADKETMINNEFHIPILCSSGLLHI